MSGVVTSLRPMLPADIAWVAACEAASQRFPWSAGHFEDCLNAGYGCWVSETDAAPIGFAIMILVVDEAHLLNFGVAPEKRRQGLGRALMHGLYAKAAAVGATQVFLEVRPSNGAALALYVNEGFAIVGRRKGYYPAETGREDALVMRREL